MKCYILYSLFSATGTRIIGLDATAQELRGWENWRLQNICTKWNIFHPEWRRSVEA